MRTMVGVLRSVSAVYVDRFVATIMQRRQSVDMKPGSSFLATLFPKCSPEAKP
jgi:hypothetical protein